MVGNKEDSIRYDLNPYPELDMVWETYVVLSNNSLQERLNRGFAMPPEATRKRVEIIKTILLWRATGVLHEPT